MKAEEIKQAIHDKGYTVALIAEALGVNRASVSVVINGHSTSFRTASLIAKVIGKPVESVFPNQPIYKTPLIRGAERAQKCDELRELLAS